MLGSHDKYVPASSLQHSYTSDDGLLDTVDPGDEIKAIIEGIVDAQDFATIRRLLGELLRCVQADKDKDAEFYPPLIEISKEKLERLTNSFTVRNLTDERRSASWNTFQKWLQGMYAANNPTESTKRRSLGGQWEGLA